MLSISHKVFCGKENTMTANESLQNGSVRKKGNQWYYRFRVQESDGSWKQREFKGGKTKKETELMLKQALNDYKYEGELFDPGSLTVVGTMRPVVGIRGGKQRYGFKQQDRDCRPL